MLWNDYTYYKFIFRQFQRLIIRHDVTSLKLCYVILCICWTLTRHCYSFWCFENNRNASNKNFHSTNAIQMSCPREWNLDHKTNSFQIYFLQTCRFISDLITESFISRVRKEPNYKNETKQKIKNAINAVCSIN